MNMDKINKVIEEAKKLSTPSQEERKIVNGIVNHFISVLSSKIKEMNIDAVPVVCGSVARGTWTKGIRDIDIFIKFSKKYENISLICKKICESCFKKFEIIHGSRDYFKVKYKNFDVEIVPVLFINNPLEAENITDLSPLHVDYIKERINENLASEIRILKKFCKANNCYGAESSVHGFSGYSLELLILYFKSFRNLAEFFENSKPKIIIDIEKHYSSSKEILKKLSPPRKKSPIILIDPILKERNACASLNYKVFSKFLFAIRNFLRNPHLSFFKEKEIRKIDLKKRSRYRGTKIFITEVKIKGNEDVFLSKLERNLGRVKSRMEKEGFRIYEYGFHKKKNKAVVYFELENWKISKRGRHYGPPVWVKKEYFDKFILKWKKKAYPFETRLAVDIKRENNGLRKLKLLLKEYLKDI